MLEKISLIWHVNIYRIQGLLGLKRIDIMSVINDYYRTDFYRLKKADVAVMLPHCLIADRCPAKFSKSDGILCTECDLCGCGEIRKLAEERGYQFYISPSVGFTRRLAQRKRLKGIIGVACDYEIERGIRSEKITDNGVKIENAKIVTQGVYLDVYDCIRNNVDWEKIRELIKP